MKKLTHEIFFFYKRNEMTGDSHIGTFSDYRLSLASCMVLGCIPMVVFGFGGFLVTCVSSVACVSLKMVSII